MSGMVWVRALVGAVWLNGAVEKLLNPRFPEQLAASLRAGGFVAEAPAPLQGFMRETVVPNAELAAQVVRYGELALGLALLVGLLTNLAALGSLAFGLVLLLSGGGVSLGTGLGAPGFITINLLVALLSLLVLLSPAAKVISVDAALAGRRRLLSPLLLNRRAGTRPGTGSRRSRRSRTVR
ncbi:MAG: DoxX family membrane protein [Rubrobacter sp.]|nr:DoxX family membrane protein [Rubrobacter sp.]